MCFYLQWHMVEMCRNNMESFFGGMGISREKKQQDFYRLENNSRTIEPIWFVLISIRFS